MLPQLSFLRGTTVPVERDEAGWRGEAGPGVPRPSTSTTDGDQQARDGSVFVYQRC